jgi:hypothetical protein
MLLLTGQCDRASQSRFKPARALFQTSDFADLIQFATIGSGAGMGCGGGGKKIGKAGSGVSDSNRSPTPIC